MHPCRKRLAVVQHKDEQAQSKSNILGPFAATAVFESDPLIRPSSAGSRPNRHDAEPNLKTSQTKLLLFNFVYILQLGNMYSQHPLTSTSSETLPWSACACPASDLDPGPCRLSRRSRRLASWPNLQTSYWTENPMIASRLSCPGRRDLENHLKISERYTTWEWSEPPTMETGCFGSCFPSDTPSVGRSSRPIRLSANWRASWDFWDFWDRGIYWS